MSLDKSHVDTMESMSSQNSSLFFQLPREIRDIIYRHVLVVDARISLCTAKHGDKLIGGWHIGSKPGSFWRKEPHRPLFSVSKRVYEEASKIFYTENKFLLPCVVPPMSQILNHRHLFRNVKVNFSRIFGNSTMDGYCSCEPTSLAEGSRDFAFPQNMMTKSPSNMTHDKAVKRMVTAFWLPVIQFVRLMQLNTLVIDFTNCECFQGCEHRLFDLAIDAFDEARYSENGLDNEDDGTDETTNDNRGRLKVKERIEIIGAQGGEVDKLMDVFMPYYPESMRASNSRWLKDYARIKAMMVETDAEISGVAHLLPAQPAQQQQQQPPPPQPQHQHHHNNMWAPIHGIPPWVFAAWAPAPPANFFAAAPAAPAAPFAAPVNLLALPAAPATTTTNAAASSGNGDDDDQDDN